MVRTHPGPTCLNSDSRFKILIACNQWKFSAYYFLFTIGPDLRAEIYQEPIVNRK
jgi:hypothetical protein